MTTSINDIIESLDKKDEVASLQWLSETFPDHIAFSTSLGYEDQVITDLICKNKIPIQLFTLDTGRLFEETYQLLNTTQDYYKKSIDVFFPETESVQILLTQKGPFSFYKSVENRKECCFIRKVEPLTRALKGKKVWVTGIRSEQSALRQDISQVEWDKDYHVIKFHPILNWTLDKVKHYIKENRVPYNLLHDKGFVSLGCSPCTRPVQPHEDFRAGRWWWESNSSKECGLHERKQP